MYINENELEKNNCPYKDDPEVTCEYCEYGLRVIPEDEQEYAFYHGGNYEYFVTVCMYIVDSEYEKSKTIRRFNDGKDVENK